MTSAILCCYEMTEREMEKGRVNKRADENDKHCDKTLILFC